MSLIPEQELENPKSFNFAPMVDFLFLVIALLATLTVTRSTLCDSELDLVKVRTPHSEPSHLAYNQQYLVNLSVSAKGTYKWITDIDEYLMQSPAAIQTELLGQVEKGLLPKEKQKTKVLLHIDKNAPWEAVSTLIFAVRESGFPIHPVYEPS